MKIAFAASEAAPFIKTGGLGDVAEALPQSLASYKGNEVCLFLPYYSKIKNNPDIKAEYLCDFGIDLSWRRQYVGLFRLKSRQKKLKVYFIDNEYYFAREKCYGYFDDGERFAFFSKAILESMLKLGLLPDIIHCNDWQTALVPVFLHAFYQDTLGRAKTVFTIHNIEYQGKADPFFLGDTLGLSGQYESTLAYDGCVNFMKGAILMCDALTTVSGTYAEEIKYPYFAHGLDPVIRDHAFKLSGIVNGINTVRNDPATDPALTANYSVNDYAAGKAKNKAALQKSLGLAVRPDVPLIGMVSRIVAHKGADLVCAEIEELMRWDIQIAILGTGDAKYESALKACADRHPDKLSVNLCFNSALASEIYSATDIFLMPSKSEPCGLSQLIAMRYGSIPVVMSTGGLRDTVIPFNPEELTGTGFTFQSFNSGDMLGALRRALEIYGGDKVKWDKLVNNAMSVDSSWTHQTGKYMELYTNLLK